MTMPNIPAPTNVEAWPAVALKATAEDRISVGTISGINELKTGALNEPEIL
jgi:hypothetical protein